MELIAFIDVRAMMKREATARTNAKNEDIKDLIMTFGSVSVVANKNVAFAQQTATESFSWCLRYSH